MSFVGEIQVSLAQEWFKLLAFFDIPLIMMQLDVALITKYDMINVKNTLHDWASENGPSEHIKFHYIFQILLHHNK